MNEQSWFRKQLPPEYDATDVHIRMDDYNGWGSGESPGAGHGEGCHDDEGYVGLAGFSNGYGTARGGCGLYAGLHFGTGSGGGDISMCRIDNHSVFFLDHIPTIVYAVCKNYAKGAIVHDDLTLEPCYIALSEHYVAHGKTLREAKQALDKKLLEYSPIENRIQEFCKTFLPNTKYPNKLFFEWHSILTGSCEMGRTAFCKDRGVSLDDETTPEEFIKLTENSYRGEIIAMLKDYYDVNDKEA